MEFTKFLEKSLETTEEDEVSLICQVVSRPNAKVERTKDSKPVTTDGEELVLEEIGQSALTEDHSEHAEARRACS